MMSLVLFTSYKYALFVAAAFCVYYLAARFSRGRRIQNLALLVLSYVFYAIWDWRWCLLLAGVTATGFLGALLLARLEARRGLVLLAVLLIDLAALGTFKYFGFFADSFSAALRGVGLHADWVTLHLVLPVGLSYYLFQNLSYVDRRLPPAACLPTRGVVDVRHRARASSRSCSPGPSRGHVTFCRSSPSAAPSTTAAPATACARCCWGLTKKMRHRRQHRRASSTTCWRNARGSTASRCSLAAVALRAADLLRLLRLHRHRHRHRPCSSAFDFPRTSTTPYRPPTSHEFWRRWHITLSSWLRDYLYIPLGGSRGGAWRHLPSICSITMLLGGLWHGASWTFIVWGGLHGSYLVIESRLRSAGERVRRASWERGKAVLAGVVVFALVTFAWVFFRAPSLSAALQFIGQAFSHPTGVGDFVRFVPTLLLSAALLVYEWFTRGWEHGLAISAAPLPARWASYVGLGMALLIFGFLGVSQGIYVQF